MPKKGQYGVPPYISLRGALEAIKEFNRRHGKQSSRTFLADILGNTPKSSSFLKKLIALRGYGLIQEKNGDIMLTPLALSIAAPTKPNEEDQAKIGVFFSVFLFKRLHEKLKGGLLPKPDMLANFLKREFLIDHKDADNWVKRFDESLHAVGLVKGKGADFMIIDKSEIAVAEVETLPITSQEKKVMPEETKLEEGDWREYSHPMGKLRIKVNAPKDVVNEFINFLRFVILSKDEKEDK